MSWVGVEEFKANYRIQTGNSRRTMEYCRSSGYCTVIYKFLHGAMYGDSLYIVFYDKLASNKINTVSDKNFPSCAKDSHRCVFVLSKEELTNLSRKEGIHDPDFRLTIQDDKMLVEVRQPMGYPFPELRSTGLFIDPYSGQSYRRGGEFKTDGLFGD